MKDNITVRLLWISDIHFREEYDQAKFDTWVADRVKKMREDNDEALIDHFLENNKSRKEKLPDIEKYLTSFITAIEKFLEKQPAGHKTIEYVILSGDLAFSGTKGDYDSFHKLIVEKLQTTLGKEVNFLCVPGNHDVYRADAQFLKQLFGNVNSPNFNDWKTKAKELRETFMKDHAAHFDMIFQPYTNYFHTHILPTISAATPSIHYESKGYFGWVIDKKRNLMINLLNSSWFALGSDFDQYLVDEFLDDSNSKLVIKTIENNGGDLPKQKAPLREYLRKLVQAKTLVQEYGGQVLGEELMPRNDFLRTIDNHSGLCVVSVFHHPQPWLEYERRFGKDNASTRNLFLNSLLERTQILLTGHEHVPSYIDFNKSGNTYHLAGGMFMQDDLLRSRSGQNRFSILEVSTTESWFKEHKFVYDWPSNEWIVFSPAKQDKPNEISPNPYVLDKDNLTGLMEKLCETKILKAIMREYFLADDEIPDDITMVEIPTDQVKLFTFWKEGVISRLVVIPSNHYFMEVAINQKNDTILTEHPFDRILAKAGIVTANELPLTFLVPSYLVESGAVEWFSDTKEYDVELKEAEVTARADINFNLSRHNFFSRFERVLQGAEKANERDNKELIVNNIKFSDIANIRLSLQVIPFWLIDKYG